MRLVRLSKGVKFQAHAGLKKVGVHIYCSIFELATSLVRIESMPKSRNLQALVTAAKAALRNSPSPST